VWFEALCKAGYRISLVSLPLTIAIFLLLSFDPPRCAGDQKLFLNPSFYFFAVTATGFASLAFFRSQARSEAKKYGEMIRSGVFDFPVISKSIPFTLAHMMFGLPLLVFLSLLILPGAFLIWSLVATRLACTL
jgi:hypothetical protein